MTRRGDSAEAVRFFKMSGSGNDFVFFDARVAVPREVDDAGAIRRLCARGTGVGADGVVFLERDSTAVFRMRYHNADGSRAEMCGNAALCSARLAVELGVAAEGSDFVFATDSGPVTGRVRDGLPEIDLAPVSELSAAAAGIEPEAGESRVGFALAGVPHLVIECPDVGRADVSGRGASLRRHDSLPQGANVNFVSRSGDSGWRYRTFERGVESETLACGTGAVATAILLVEWGLAQSPVALTTRSGERLVVRLARGGRGGRGQEWLPTLRGPARIVYEGLLRETGP